MLSLESALSAIDERVVPVGPEPFPLTQSTGRVLRQYAGTETDLPPFDRSAMDGYAIRRLDPTSRFRVAMTVRAGDSAMAALQDGECARIFTGAELPPSADQVIMQELAEVDGEWVEFRDRPLDSAVRRRGEEAQAGQILLRPGMILRPIEMGTLAVLGVSLPLVSRQVRVVHVVSGDELIEVGEQPQGAQIRDANSTLVRSFLHHPRYRLVSQGRVPDNLDEAYRITLEALESECEVLLISGGASVGEHDHAAALLERLGFTLHFRQLDLRPGKPLIFATKGAQLAFAIPGNPVSHLVCLELLVRPALDRLAGVPPVDPWLTGLLAADFAYTPNSRETFWPAHWSQEGREILLHPLPWKSSGHLSALIPATALLRLPGKAGPFPRGTSLAFRFI